MAKVFVFQYLMFPHTDHKKTQYPVKPIENKTLLYQNNIEFSKKLPKRKIRQNQKNVTVEYRLDKL